MERGYVVVDTRYAEWRTRWPKVVTECDTQAAAGLVKEYYSTMPSGRQKYSGSQFEAIAARNPDLNSIDTADIVAVSMLSVDVPGPAALRLLSSHAAVTITQLLSLIPNCDIIDADPAQLAPGVGAASELWRLLKTDPTWGKDRIGKTTASKLMAVKRPKLIPVWDSNVEKATGLGTDDYWRQFQQVLLDDDKRIWHWLNDIRPQVPELPDDVSTLRLLDVILWMLVRHKLA